MNFFIVVALSVIVGMISSLFPGEDKLILDDIIFYTIISLCTVTLIKVGLKNKTKINKINNVIIGYFAIEDDEELKEGDDLVKRPSENMLGVVTLLLGGIGFLFGPQIIYIPIVTLLFGLITIETLDTNKEQNPFSFIIGILFSLTGVVLNLIGYTHILM